MTIHKSDIMPEPLYRLKKKSPEKCQDCECLETNFKNDNWLWECSTKPNCYKDPQTNRNKAIKEKQ